MARLEWGHTEIDFTALPETDSQRELREKIQGVVRRIIDLEWADLRPTIDITATVVGDEAEPLLLPAPPKEIEES